MQFKNKSYANRGMDLEKMVNEANTYYGCRNECVMIKVPTPKKILYKNCNGYRVPVKAFYEQKSWLDYVGTIKGVPVTFDAKECKNKTSFPLSNIAPHQIQALKQWHWNGGKGFLIVYFTIHNKMYLLPYELLMEYHNASLNGGRKSIPYNVFQEQCYEIAGDRMIVCDWIKAYRDWEVCNELQ